MQEWRTRTQTLKKTEDTVKHTSSTWTFWTTSTDNHHALVYNQTIYMYIFKEVTDGHGKVMQRESPVGSRVA